MLAIMVCFSACPCERTTKLQRQMNIERYVLSINYNGVCFSACPCECTAKTAWMLIKPPPANPKPPCMSNPLLQFPGLDHPASQGGKKKAIPVRGSGLAPATHKQCVHHHESRIRRPLRAARQSEGVCGIVCDWCDVRSCLFL